MDIFKLAALGVVGALCALVLRRRVPELALVLVLGTGAILLSRCAEAAAQLKGFTDALVRTAGVSPQVWAPVWKSVGIGVVTRLAAAVCRDGGEGGVAAFLETAGAILALVTLLPLLELVLDAFSSFL